MSATFSDLSDKANPDNGLVLVDGAAAKRLITRNAVRPPFFAELLSDGQTKLLIGLGSKICCAQFTGPDNEPPYLLATIPSEVGKSGYAEFLTSEPSEVPLRLCVPLSVLLDVAAYFVETGERSPNVNWSEI